MTIVRLVTVALLTGLVAAPVYAQGPYVGASIGADIARFTSSEGYDNPATGEAVSWALRLGGPIGSRFGVELEFARPEQIENDQTPDFRILSALGGGTISGILDVAPSNVTSTTVVVPGTAIFPVPFSVRTARRNATLTASAWARQEVSRRFSMVYLGGIGFNRIEQVWEYNFGSGNRVNPLIPTILPRSTRTTEYSVGPMVGVEARVGMSDHVRLVPGVRLHGLQGGWLVRPAVGLAWEF
jgi:hypothetical protein